MLLKQIGITYCRVRPHLGGYSEGLEKEDHWGTFEFFQ